MAGGDGADRVQFETAQASHYFQDIVRVRVFWLVSREMLFDNSETPGVLQCGSDSLGHEGGLQGAVS